MPLGTAKDKKGNPHVYIDVDGRWFPVVFNEDILRDIPNVKVRDDDVLLCGYLRSGTHWLFEMLHMLQNGNSETVPMWKGAQMLEFTSKSDLDLQPSPRVLNTHLYYSELPNGFTLDNKIVYVLRDPRDVAVSYYRMYIDIKSGSEYTGDWDSYLDMFLSGEVQWGSWFDHINKWEEVISSKQHKDILLIYYEDTHKDPIKTVQRLSDFLGLQPSEGLISEIAEKCSFSQMKGDKEKYTFIFEGKNVMYRKGVVGDWKNWFTVAQSEMFDRQLQERVGNSELVKRYLHQ